jgi:hypothetical protein
MCCSLDQEKKNIESGRDARCRPRARAGDHRRQQTVCANRHQPLRDFHSLKNVRRETEVSGSIRSMLSSTGHICPPHLQGWARRRAGKVLRVPGPRRGAEAAPRGKVGDRQRLRTQSRGHLPRTRPGASRQSASVVCAESPQPARGRTTQVETTPEAVPGQASMEA